MKKLLVKALKYGVLFCVAFVVVVALLPRIPFFGRFQSLVVLSGSMEPTIKTGSVVLVRAQPDYQVGDIVTFTHPNDPQTFITHRVVTLSEGDKIITRGDANPSSDMQEISVDDIQGKVILSVPYLGYVANFARTRFGFAIFIILPAILIIIDEVRGLITGRSDSSGEHSIRALTLFFVAAFSFGVSLAYFSDTEAAVGNVLSVSVDWGEEPSVGPGDVVINEVMWMGASLSSADEWIELRNMTADSIDLSGWVLENAGTSGPNKDLTIPGGKTIPTNGYFLISNYLSDHPSSRLADTIIVDWQTSYVSLGNSGEQLTLKDSLGVTIDQTPSGSWPAGYNEGGAGLNQSMERNGDPATGWHTCKDESCNDTVYWDSEEDDFGTPKDTNSLPVP